MDWKRKLGKGLNQGIDQSKNLLDRAKEQAKNIGEQTLLNTEIKELQKKEKSLYETLGKKVYDILSDPGRSSISAKTAEIKELFPEIQAVIQELAAKQMLIKKEEKNQ